jgi:ABC-2 type transport system permease protein
MITIARADLRRMLHRRGLVLTGLLAPALLAVAIIGIREALHIVNPAEHPIAGGPDLLAFATFVTLVSVVFGTVIGAIFGAEDVAGGTLRYILLTGCSRLRLYLVRVPLVALVALLVALPGLVLMIVGAFVLPHAGAPSPTMGEVWEQVLGLLVNVTVFALLAYGIGVAIRSTGGAIAVALGLNLVGLNLLSAITLLVPASEQWLLTPALTRVVSGGESSILIALLTTVIWVGVFLSVGLVRALRTEA